MREQQMIDSIKDYIKKKFQHDPTGHDYFHMERVAAWSRKIAEQEGGSPFICEVAGWLHDVGDAKLFTDPIETIQQRSEFLNELGLSKKQIIMIDEAIRDVSYSKGKTPSSLEGRIVQDADRLDAIGAIGIARTFAFGGARGQLIDSDSNEPTSVQHFYDKLLKLSSLMNTKSGAIEAEYRDKVMVNYLKELKREQQITGGDGNC